MSALRTGVAFYGKTIRFSTARNETRRKTAKKDV